MSIARIRTAAALACLLVASVAGMRASAQEPQPVDLAVLQAPREVGLEDILSGRARVGFNPVIGERITLRADDRAIWLRVRAPGGGAGAQQVRLERQAIDRVQLFVPADPRTPVAETGLSLPKDGRAPAAQSFLLPIPRGPDGAGPLYVRIEGRGFLYLHPQLLTDAQVEQREKASAGLDRWVNLLLGLVAIFGLVRAYRQPGSGALGLTVAAVLVGLACFASNGQLHRVPGTAGLVSIGPKLVPALWLLACGPLLWATRRFAGLDKHSPGLSTGLFWLGAVFIVVGLAALFVPPSMLLTMQVTALVGLGVAAVAGIAGVLADPRSARWSALLAWLGVLAALGAQALIHLHQLPPTLLARRGVQPMLALLLAVYLVLPWVREIVRDRAKLKRAVVPEPTTEEKIEQAREQLMASLQSGLANASEGDMEWIAYRRLLEGLKPVLPQVASAVVAMNYHHEDLLLVEPKDAEPRYRMLLQQRGQLLKNLSRSKAPQQIGLDFDGPQGPLAHVQLAVIPLPIDKPGWGALIIERNATVEYSEIELDLCAEFAALATTAGDEAAEALEARQANEYDPESGVYRQEVIDRVLRKAHEAAFLQRKPLGVLRVGHDDKAAPIRPLAELLRDEIDYGESVGRWAQDELLVLAPELAPAAVRELGERLLAAARKQGLSVSIGAATLNAGERAPNLMLDRAASALARVRANGGNLVQLAVSGT
jgi:GGDEF domain-containing protein